MNILHYSRRVAQGLLLFALLIAAATEVKAQCTLEPQPLYAPVPSIVLPVDAAPPGGGDVDLNNNVISAYFFSDCNITPLGVVRFYDDPVLTNPGFPIVGSITFTCADINVVVNRSYWVTVAPIGSPGQASPRRELKVTIIDNLPPVIACPANFSGFTNPSNACSLNIGAGLSLTTATDNCTNPPNIVWSSTGATIGAGVTSANGTTFNRGVTTVTYTASDASLNSTTCSFTVTVTDNDPPVPTCPGPVSRNTDPGACTYTYLSSDPVTTAIDNCDLPPVISYSLAGATVAGPLATLTGVTFNRGVTTVTATAGTLPFTASCPFTVTVSDAQAPTIGTIPSNQTIGTSTGVSTPLNLCDGTYNWTHPTVGDNCVVASQTVEFSGATVSAAAAFTPGNATGSVNFNLGVTTVTYLVTDNTGNTTSKVFTVTVQDDAAPTNISETAQNFSVPVDPLNCTKDITWTRPSIGAPSDCGSVTIHEEFVSGPNPNVLTGLPAFNTATGGGTVNTNFPAGTTVIRYSWRDNSMASPDFSVLYTFTVTETVLPIATCLPGNTITLDPNGNATLFPITVGSASDNCPLGLVSTISLNNVTYTPNITFSNCVGLGANIVYFRATDAFGNSATCSTTITVLDNTAPSVVCPNAVTANILAGDPSVCFKTIGSQGNLTLDGDGTLVAGEYDDNCSVTKITWAANNGASPSASAASGVNTNLGAVQFQKGLTTVTYTLTDASNNVSFCNFTVNVVDLQPPVAVNCPSNITVNANQQPGCNFKLGGTPPLGWTWLGPISFSNNCTPTSFTPAGQPSHLQTFSLGDNVITINGIDGAGNVGTCTFTITVQDNTDPVAVCATPLTATLNGAGTVMVSAATFNGGSSDNCYQDLIYEVRRGADPYGPSVSFSCADLAGMGVQTVSLRVSENGGVRSATTNCSITIKDETAPALSCPSVLNVELAANGLETLTVSDITSDFAYSFSDNCSASPASIGISENASGPFGASIPVDCSDVDVTAPIDPSFVGYVRVTDGSGNEDICTFNVFVLDVTAPALAISNSAVTVDCSALPAAYAPQFITSDACDATLTPVQVGGDLVIPGACQGEQTIIKTFEVEDASGNVSNQVSQTITFVDNTAPTITVPANITLSLQAEGNCYPIKTYNATFADNCTANATLLANGGWTILYADGLTESDDPMTNADNATATSFIGLTSFGTGVNTITFFTADDCGNPVTKSFTVTVVDDVKPSFADYLQPTPIQSIPPQTTYCGATFVLNNSANNCGASFEWYRPYAGPAFPIGPGTVFPDVTDCNQLTLTESIITTLPNPPGGTQTQVPNIAFNGFNPLNGLVPSNLFLPVGTTTFTYTANDGKGNTQTCVFNVQIKDTQVPVITCPASVTLNSICPTQTVPDYRTLVNITDNCVNNVVVSQSKQGLALSNTAGIDYLPTPSIPAADPTDGSEFNVVFTAVDGSNNAAVPCTTKVVLNDADAPIPTVASLPNLVWNCGFAIVNTPTAGPNCGVGPNIFGTPGGVSATPHTVVSGNITQYKVTGVGNFFITWSYNDGNGNIATQLQQLTINADVAPPTATCNFTNPNAPLNIVLDATGNASITAATIGTGADPDNCGSVTTSISKTNYSCSDLQLTTVTFTATDVAGNTATCIANIKVIDNLAPVLPNPPANETIECGTNPSTAVVLTATDNCKGTFQVSAQEILQPNANFCDNNVDIVRTWIASDASGNQTVKTQGIIVKDTQAPVWTNGSGATITINSALVNPTCDQTVTLVMTADSVKDACSQLSNLIITKSISGPGYTPNCPILPGIQPGQCASGTYKVGTHTILFTATDPCGNSSTHLVTLIVKDVAPPVAACVNGVSITLNPNGQAVVTPNLLNNNSFDNCNNGLVTLQVQQLEAPNGDTIGQPANSIVFDCDEADEDETYPIVLWVTDAAGNKSFCETYVTVQDNVTPTITCPPSKNIDCTLSIAPNINGNGAATATDNCQQNVAITYTDFPANNGYTCQTVARTWVASDSSGNSSSCVQNFNIKDDKAPTFTYKPPSDTISCNDPLLNQEPEVADNCTPADSIKVVLTEVSTKANSGCGKYSYTTTRTWVATDKCGNSSTYTQTLVVLDTFPPELLAPHVINVQTANFPPTTNCTAPVSLNPGLVNSFSDCATLSECTINSIQFIPALVTPITPTLLDVSGNYPVGTTKVVFKITDPCGNQLIDTFTVNVIDNSTPIAICNNNVVVALGNNGQATIDVNDIDLNSTDNCGIQSRVLSQSTFDCTDLGSQPVTMTVTDIYGNVNSCNVTVDVTAGVNTGFTLTATSTPTTYFGATDGKVTAAATGGSNNFAYAWSVNNATTAMVSGLAAGTYTVTVTDQFTGCQQTTTVTVLEGPKVKITVGAGSGMQNSVVKVPVFADNFVNISGFSFSIDLTNLTVGTIVSPVAIVNQNPALTGIFQGNSATGSDAGIIYVNGTGSNVTLPNGSKLFDLCIQLSGAAIGTSSPLVIDGSPVQVIVQRVVNSNLVNVPVDLVDGTVQITAGLDNYDIKGLVKIYGTQPQKFLPDVMVSITGNGNPLAPQPNPTNANGAYERLDIQANTNTVTSCSKLINPNTAGATVNVQDLLRVITHIFAGTMVNSPLNDPITYLSADVNADGKVDISDLALIQAYINGTPNPAFGQWRFIREGAVLPSLPTATNAVYTVNLNNFNTISHTPLIQDQLTDNFWAFRLGDANSTNTTQLTNDDVQDRSGTELKFMINEQEAAAGQTIEVPFKAKDFIGYNGYQFTLRFDPNQMELEDIIPGNLPNVSADMNFGTGHLTEGFLTSSWVNIDPVTMNDDEVLFTLKFRALAAVNALSDNFSINSDVTAAMGLPEEGTLVPVTLGFTEAQTTSSNNLPQEPFVLYQNQPNPANGNTMIGFRLPKAERGTLRVFNTSGQLVRTVVGNFEKGYNTVVLKKEDLGGHNGVYYYELSTPTYSDRKKMILID